MDSIFLYFANVGIDLGVFLRFSGILLLGALLVSGISRFIFRKQTLLESALSSSIAIIFIYIVMVLIITIAKDLNFLVAPLPFVSITTDSITFFAFDGAAYPVIASQLLSMVILSFLVNLADMWFPRGKNLINWLSFRTLTVIFGFLMHFLVTWLFAHYCPVFIVQYAPAVLLAILLIMLLTGALRFIVGLILTTVNPIIAALYTFFFANIVGRQITKAVMTAAICSGAVLLLRKYGLTALSLEPGALVAYIPFLLVFVPVWYLVSRP